MCSPSYFNIGIVDDKLVVEEVGFLVARKPTSSVRHG